MFGEDFVAVLAENAVGAGPGISANLTGFVIVR